MPTYWNDQSTFLMYYTILRIEQFFKYIMVICYHILLLCKTILWTFFKDFNENPSFCYCLSWLQHVIKVPSLIRLICINWWCWQAVIVVIGVAVEEIMSLCSGKWDIYHLTLKITMMTIRIFWFWNIYFAKTK